MSGFAAARPLSLILDCGGISGRLHLGTHSTRCFIGNDAQAVTAFTRQTMHQTPRVFVREASGFAAAFADYRPSVVRQSAHHLL
jgi:hypothetical protein